MRNFLQKKLDKYFPAPKVPPIPVDPEKIATEVLKNELLKEYLNLIEIKTELTAKQKYDLAKLTQMPEWQTFAYTLERYKAILFSKGAKHGESKDDLLIMKAQMKNVSVFKTFWKRFRNVKIPTDSLTEASPESTISLDEQ